MNGTGNSGLDATGLGLLFALAMVTAIRPKLSLGFFVIFAPCALVADFLGFDARFYWAFILGFYALVHWSISEKSVLPRGAMRGWFAFVVFAAIGLWFGSGGLSPEDYEIAKKSFYCFVAVGFLFSAFGRFLQTPGDVRRVFMFLCTSVLLAASFVFWEASELYKAGGPGRVLGLSGNPNYQAGYFAVSATLLLMYRRCEVGFRRGLYSFAIAVAWLGCFLCLSRSGAFALIVGAAGHWLLLSARRFSLRRIFVALIPVVGIILLLFSEATMELRNRLTFSDDPRVESLAQVGQSLEDISRFEAAGYAIDLFAAHPLLGVGLGTFAARNFEARGSYVAPHNSLLGSLAETGLVGVLALWFVFRALFRATDPAARKYIAPTVVAAIAFAAFADVLNSLEVVTVLFLVYSCCARFGAAPFEERVAKPAAAARHLSLHAPPVGDTI